MITKTQYLNYRVCSKNFWLSTFKNDVKPQLTELEENTIHTGISIGALAKQYFADTYDCSRLGANGFPSCNEQVQVTQDAIKENHRALAEASFIFDDLYCAVDLLVKEEDGYSIYEVKSSSTYKTQHLFDVAFQKYVLTKCGLKINHSYVMHLNSSYCRKGDIDVHELFSFEDVELHKDTSLTFTQIEADLMCIRNILKETKEISVPFSKECKKCPFHDYCTKRLPSNNVSKIAGIKASKAYQLINYGVVTMNDYINAGFTSNSELVKKQIDSAITGTKRSVSKVHLNDFLSKLKYPLYHLDFETLNEAVPPFDGAHPYERIPFQYSLHIEEKKGGPYRHEEFLGKSLDCRRELAEKLCHDIPMNSTVIAFNSSFEGSVIKNLAHLYPDLEKHLLSLSNNLLDLEEPFKKGAVYDKEQGGSTSIKHVMPAFCPSIKDSYRNLPLVHNGGEALSMFPKLMNMSGAELSKAREGMLKYCELDTLSMVEVLKVLYKEAL